MMTAFTKIAGIGLLSVWALSGAIVFAQTFEPGGSNSTQNTSNRNADVLNQATYNQSGTVTSSGDLSYTPLEPLPGAPTSFGSGTNFGTLLNYIFKIALSLGALTAVVMLVLGGITYMVSDVVNKKDEARHRIQNALWGLLLIIGAYLILNTINPQLVSFADVFKPAASTYVPNQTSSKNSPSVSNSGTPANSVNMQVKQISELPTVIIGVGGPTNDQIQQINQLEASCKGLGGTIQQFQGPGDGQTTEQCVPLPPI